MKKFAALVLALALALTAVSALAATGSISGPDLVKVSTPPFGNNAYAISPLEGLPLAMDAVTVRAGDALALAEQKRIAACDPIESAFAEDVAAAVAGAKDINSIVSIVINPAADLSNGLVLSFETPVAFEGEVVALLGIYDATTAAYNYAALPTTLNESGSVTVELSADQAAAGAAAASTIVVFIEK